MPEYEGLIKYPVAADKYNTTYGEPQWWRDLAITTRAEITAQTAYRTHTSGSFNADDAMDGNDLVHTAVTQSNFPGAGTWWLNTATVTGAARMQEALLYGGDPQTWRRFRGSVWSGWVRVDAGAVPPAASGGAGSASAFKRVPLVLTAATGSGTDSTGSGAIRFPIHYAAPITRWRVHVRNHNYASGVNYTSGGTVSGMWFGEGWDGAFTQAPTQVAYPLTIPTDGADAVTPWISTPIKPDTQQMLSIGWTASTSSPKVLTPGGGWRSTSSGSAPAQSGAGFTVNNWFPFDWWIEAETPATTPTIAGYGDSITAGTGTTLLVHDSWLAQYARTVGGLPLHYAYPGSGMVLWQNAADPKWTRWADFPPADAAIHFMGQNDLGTATTAAIMRDRFETTMPMIKAHISPNVYAATITPHAGKTAAQNTVRREHATYLRTLPEGIRDVFDFAAAVSNDDTTLRDEFLGGNGTDELHPNTAGAAAMAAAIARLVVPERSGAGTTAWVDVTGKPATFPPSTHTHDGVSNGAFKWSVTSAGAIAANAGGSNTWQIDANTGRLITGEVPWARLSGVPDLSAHSALTYDSGPRDVSSLLANGWTGTAYLQRTGADVQLRLEGVQAPSTGSTSPFAFPDGFKPRGTSGYAARGLTFTTALTIRRYDVAASTSALTIRNHNEADLPFYSEISFKTNDPLPATLPGA